METEHESQRHSLKVNGCFHRGPSATIQHQTDTENWSTKGKKFSEFKVPICSLSCHYLRVLVATHISFQISNFVYFNLYKNLSKH